jgi:hypothetical protein
MITVKTYLYPNIIEVQVFDPTVFTTRNRTVYSRTIKVYQGIDNPLQIVVKNQDQKSVDLTGYAVEVQIQDPVNQITVQTFPVTFVDITKGTATVTLDKATVDSLEQRFYKLTVKTINQDSLDEAPLYIDDNYGVPLDLQVLPAYYSDIAAPVLLGQTVIDGGTI